MKNVLTVRCIAKLGLIVSVATVVQSLRLIIPLPPLITLLGIGTVLNACLIYSIKLASMRGAILVGILVPFIALLQQAFFSSMLIIPAISANIIYAWCYVKLANHSMWIRFFAPAVMRALTLYVISMFILNSFGFSNLQLVWLQAWVCFAQLITGVGGIYLCEKFASKVHL